MIKAQIVAACEEILAQRLKRIEDAMRLSREAAEGETKSSAGDKYETTRAMMHAEMEKLAAQRDEVVKMKAALYNVTQARSANEVGLGSLVKTDVALYFIAIGIGRVTIGKGEVMVLSPASPLGRLLLGKKVAEHITFNGKSQIIQEIN